MFLRDYCAGVNFHFLLWVSGGRQEAECNVTHEKSAQLINKTETVAKPNEGFMLTMKVNTIQLPAILPRHIEVYGGCFPYLTRINSTR